MSRQQKVCCLVALSSALSSRVTGCLSREVAGAEGVAVRTFCTFSERFPAGLAAAQQGATGALRHAGHDDMEDTYGVVGLIINLTATVCQVLAIQ